MFYSQFILAKKGPLGTIWIAAHLERKLRKNQVADTDIGVSVDSILFPEVPIALRLSSHLLLGVVRIYSRKVNYLFDDCSEALLKVKQAFRSTAVDLPPEESTAPYHSITLPETFDLDDFELPDNDIFQGNYVDHHISTREQITLQDTMDGVVYSTSQFGLDERFGDGDTSQVGLDLEEDLFLEKIAATGHNEVSENDASVSAESMKNQKKDGSHERMIECLEDMPLNGTRNKIDDHTTNLKVDVSQAPSNMLVEEQNVSSVKEFVVHDDHFELEDHHARKFSGMGVLENDPSKSDNDGNDAMNLSLGNNLNNDTTMCIPAEEHNHLSGDLDINQAELGRESPFTAVTAEHGAPETVVSVNDSQKVENENKVVSCNNEQIVMATDRISGDCEESLEEAHDVKVGSKIEELLSNRKAVASPLIYSSELPSSLGTANVEGQGCQVQKNPETLNVHVNHEKELPTCIGNIQPCNSSLTQVNTLSGEADNSVLASDLQLVDGEPMSSEILQREEDFHPSGTSTKVQGEERHVTDGVLLQNEISESTLNGEIQADEVKDDEPLDNTKSNDHQNGNSSSMTSEFPAPEKLLSLPQMLPNKPHDLLVETPDKEFQEEGDGSSAGIRISGKKRSFAECSLDMQSLNSSESFGMARSKRSVDSIPNDDDLLSSILVGRKSSVLKVKPTPPLPEVPSMKHGRLASRSSALKRKVLMDDSMVLHGDTIRQQLTNTEDIRRLRKKAPCTRSEILMLQRQFLEEEIFGEPILTGMAVNLTRLHGEALDLSGIKICENDDSNMASLEGINDGDPARQFVIYESEMGGSVEPVGCRANIDGQTSAISVQSDNQEVEDHGRSPDIDNQENANVITDTVDYRISEHENLGETSELDNDKVNVDIADATDHSVMEVKTYACEPVSGEFFETLSITVNQSAVMGKTIDADEFTQVDAPTIPSNKIDNQLIENIACSRERIKGIETDGTELINNPAENIVAIENELGAGGELLLEDSKYGASVEIGDEQPDGSAPFDGTDAPLANVSSETGGCISFRSAVIDQTSEEIENEKYGVHTDGGLGGSSISIDNKDQTSNSLCCEQANVDSKYSIGLDEDYKIALMNDGDNTVCTQNAPLVHTTTRAHDDIQSVGFADNTEFLNVDDDEIDIDYDEGFSNAEDTPLLENSGWSSRTRAVAKFLQTLFDKEAEHGAKVVMMDNLLTGKTCKEASRMFFETLVLKTKDYVHVEQAKPFGNINIKPQAKLMKSVF